MKRVFLMLTVLLGCATLARAAPADFVFPGVPGYELQKQSRRFQQQEIEFQLPESRKTKSVTHEGYLTESRYAYTIKVKVASPVIVEHYAQALKNIGGEILLRRSDALHGTFQHNNRQCYLMLNAYDGGIYYLANVLEVMDIEYGAGAQGEVFPSLPNYTAGRKVKNFARLRVKSMPAGGTKVKEATYEGALAYTFYGYDGKANSSSGAQICGNYQDAVKAMGGDILYYKEARELHASFARNGKSYYMVLKIIDGGARYDVSILEVQAKPEAGESAADDSMARKLEKEGHVALSVHFDTGKAVIKPESDEEIEAIVTALRARPDMKVRLEGHTDNIGSATVNTKLSADRARAVMDAIVAKGINASRLSATGFGPGRPMADNGTEDGRTRNRRVEMVRLQ